MLRHALVAPRRLRTGLDNAPASSIAQRGDMARRHETMHQPSGFYDDEKKFHRDGPQIFYLSKTCHQPGGKFGGISFSSCSVSIASAISIH
jgi:hypothetical protein